MVWTSTPLEYLLESGWSQFCRCVHKVSLITIRSLDGDEDDYTDYGDNDDDDDGGGDDDDDVGGGGGSHYPLNKVDLCLLFPHNF